MLNNIEIAMQAIRQQAKASGNKKILSLLSDLGQAINISMIGDINKFKDIKIEMAKLEKRFQHNEKRIEFLEEENAFYEEMARDRARATNHLQAMLVDKLGFFSDEEINELEDYFVLYVGGVAWAFYSDDISADNGE